MATTQNGDDSKWWWLENDHDDDNLKWQWWLKMAMTMTTLNGDDYDDLSNFSLFYQFPNCWIVVACGRHGEGGSAHIQGFSWLMVDCPLLHHRPSTCTTSYLIIYLLLILLMTSEKAERQSLFWVGNFELRMEWNGALTFCLVPFWISSLLPR